MMDGAVLLTPNELTTDVYMPVTTRIKRHYYSNMQHAYVSFVSIYQLLVEPKVNLIIRLKKKLNGDHYIHHFIGACSVAYTCRNNDGLYARTLLRS